MLKIFALILAWIVLSSCKPESEKVCGYFMYEKSNVIGQSYTVCLTEPAQRPDGLFQCVNHESKLVAVANVVKVEEGCW